MKRIKTNLKIAALMVVVASLFAPAYFAKEAHSEQASSIKPLPTRRPNLDIMKIAHRGVKMLSPENTIPALEKAILLGYDYVEVDLAYTRDGVPVLMHDPTLSRTTDGFGILALTGFEKIKRLDAGSWFGPEFAGTKIPTLEECLQVMEGKIKLYLDQKGPPTPELLPLLKKYGFYPDNIVVVGLKNFQKKFLEYAPHAPVMPKLKNAEEVEKVLRQFPSAIAFNTGSKTLTPEMVEKAHKHGVMVFTNVLRADNPSEERKRMRRTVEMGSDAMQFDNIEMFDWVIEQMRSE